MNECIDILIVEDESVVIRAAKRVLISEGLTLHAVESVKDAMSNLEMNQYKIILSDLMLPEISGFELIKMITKKYPGIPIIMITGYATCSNVICSFQLGAFDFIAKPFDIEILLGSVNNALRFVDKQKENPINLSGNDDQGELNKEYYLGQHSWARIEPQGDVLIGMGNWLSYIAGITKQITYPAIGEEIIQGNSCVRIIAEDQLEMILWAPLSGIVLAVNNSAFIKDQRITENSLSKNWLVRVKPVNLESETVNLRQGNFKI